MEKGVVVVVEEEKKNLLGVLILSKITYQLLFQEQQGIYEKSQQYQLLI
jgi:hypothetical protein